MSLIDELGGQEASARQAVAFAQPKTALAALTPAEAEQPAVQQVVRLSPGANVPEQEPPPKAPADRAYEQSAFGKTIAISLGRRRLAGIVIQSSAIVPRLVGNTEYEVTYEIPAVEVEEPEQEMNDGDPAPAIKTIWCNDCNCYYCYVGPLDVFTPYDNFDKGTWPYMAMMGTWRSQLCVAWEYRRMAGVDDDLHYGALYPPHGGFNDMWVYRPPTGTGLPNDPLVPLTCGPCAGDAPFPDAVEADLEQWGNQGTAPAPYTPFQYGGWFRYEASELEDSAQELGFGFWYKAQSGSAMVRKAVGASHFKDPHMYRVYYDPNKPQSEWPGSRDVNNSGQPLMMPEGWHCTADDEMDVEIWTEEQAVSGLINGPNPPWWNPGGGHWRDWVKAHGGWAPEDEPMHPPDYKMVEVRRIDPDDPFSEFKLLPTWGSGMLYGPFGVGENEFSNPEHSIGGIQCTSITDYSDI